MGTHSLSSPGSGRDPTAADGLALQTSLPSVALLRPLSSPAEGTGELGSIQGEGWTGTLHAGQKSALAQEPN